MKIRTAPIPLVMEALSKGQTANDEKRGNQDDRWPFTRLAQIVSEISNPLFVALPTFGVLALHTAPDPARALLWWIVTTLGITAAPLIFIAQGVRRQRYANRHLPVREERFVPLLFGLACACLAFALLLLLHASSTLLATIVAALVTGAIAGLITRYWKISFHLIGIAGAVTVFVLVFGALSYLLVPLVMLVGWARWEVRAHTFLQALMGAALAVAVTVAIFRLLGV